MMSGSDKRISDSIEQSLNQQMMNEAFQAQAYLALASWAEVNNFAGLADFFISIPKKNAPTCLSF